MKKTMKMPAKLACLFFLILGLSLSVNAQTLVNVAETEYQLNSTGDKVSVTLAEGAEAITRLRTEFVMSYPAPLPDQNSAANATYVYKRNFLKLTWAQIAKGLPSTLATHVAYEELTNLVADSQWSHLVNEDWRDEVITLLAN